MGHLAGVRIRDGTTTLMDSLVSANHGYGVVVFGEDTRVVIQNTTISDHIFSGIVVGAGTLTLDEVTIQNNGIDVFAGLNVNAGLVEIRSSHITQNHHGGIYSYPEAEVNLIETVLDENEGDSFGAFFNQGTANISASLIANNVGEAAAAIENRGDMTIINSTVSGNENLGISIFEGNLSLTYVTIAENERGGISVSRRIGNLMFTNVLIAKNLLGDCNITSSGTPDPILAGVNIATSPGCAFPALYSSDEIMLADLADNGGPTLTHALLAGSPAIDAATSTCPEGDQRLIPRPFGPACDVGAYESGAVTPLSLEVTATPDMETLIVTGDFPCYTGPGPQYNTLSTLKAGDELQIVGYGFGGGWLVGFHPTLQGQHCWIDEDFVALSVPVGELRLIAIPAKLTSTPTPEKREEEPTACPTLGQFPGQCQ